MVFRRLGNQSFATDSAPRRSIIATYGFCSSMPQDVTRRAVRQLRHFVVSQNYSEHSIRFRLDGWSCGRQTRFIGNNAVFTRCFSGIRSPIFACGFNRKWGRPPEARWDQSETVLPPQSGVGSRCCFCEPSLRLGAVSSSEMLTIESGRHAEIAASRRIYCVRFWLWFLGIRPPTRPSGRWRCCSCRGRNAGNGRPYGRDAGHARGSRDHPARWSGSRSGTGRFESCKELRGPAAVYSGLTVSGRWDSSWAGQIRRLGTVRSASNHNDPRHRCRCSGRYEA